MIKPELLAILNAQAAKHDIRGEDFDALIDWVENTIISKGILENVEHGFIEIVSMGASGPSLSITHAGIKHVEDKP